MEIVKKTRFPHVQGVNDEKSPETILEHDRIIWLGDLNYRIALSYRSAKALVEMQNWRALLEKDQVVRVPAVGQTKAIDATGAGDLFAGGFLYGLVKGLSLEECCIVGSCSGGSVIRSLGGEVSEENWQWMYKQLKTNGLSAPAIVHHL